MNTQEIYEQMLQDYTQATGETMDGACDLAVRLYAAAAQLETLYYYADWSRRQAFAQTASGEYLDYHGQTRGVTRQEGSCATGTIRFSVSAALANDLTIPEGTVVSTMQQTRFVTTQAGVLTAGSTYVDCAAKAEVAGTAGNITAGAAVCLTQAPVGVSACRNLSAFTGGAQAEDDESYRARILESFKNASNGANAAYYRQSALSVAGVAACSVLPKQRGVGTVDVVIAAPGGTPDDALVTQVQTKLEAEREIGVDVLVYAPVNIPITLAVTLWPLDGVRYADAAAAVNTAINSFFNGKLLAKPLYRSALGRCILDTQMVKNYAITAPLSDTAISRVQLPILSSLTLTEGT